MFLNHPLYSADLCSIFDMPLPWEQLNEKTVLITGVTGMIGSAIADALRLRNQHFGAQIRIIGLCRRQESFESRFPACTEIEPQIQDAAEPVNVDYPFDYIIHTAGNAHPLSFSTKPVETLMESVISTRHLLQLLHSQAHGRLLYTSSGEIYGENPAIEDGYAETDFGKIDPTSPRACYPEGKRAAETLCAAFRAEYGVDSVIARLGYVYGAPINPANSRADAQFLRCAAKGVDIILKSPGLQLRSYCYLPDAVAGIFTLLLKGESAQAYNIAGTSATIREYAETLARHANVQLRFDLPPEAEQRGYSQVTRAIQRTDKLQSLGWRQMLSLDEGLSHTLQIYRDIHPAQE